MTDLRDASTIPLNFTKSINLALSERGTNAIYRSGARGKDLLASVVRETVPMGGRMIHGKDTLGELTDKAQAYGKTDCASSILLVGPYPNIQVRCQWESSLGG